MSYNLLEYLKADLSKNSVVTKGGYLVFNYRVANWVQNQNKFIKFCLFPILIWYRFFVCWPMGFDVPSSTKIGKGFEVHHGTSIVVHPRAILGDDVCLLHEVTIGIKDRGHDSIPPTLENSIKVGAGAKILGDIVIGSNTRIGAMTLVIKDVPCDSIVVGNPMRIL